MSALAEADEADEWQSYLEMLAEVDHQSTPSQWQVAGSHCDPSPGSAAWTGLEGSNCDSATAAAWAHSPGETVDRGSGRQKEARRRSTAKTKGGARLLSSRQYQQANAELEAKSRQYCQAQQENRLAKYRIRNLEAGLEAVEIHQQLLSIPPRRAPPLLEPPPASCSEVSFAALPHASQWDAAWVERIRGLTARDVLTLRRQWLQQSSVLVLQAETGGTESEAHRRLDLLHERHIAFIQSIVVLAPEAWRMTSQFDMETLQAVPPPSPEWLVKLYSNLFSEECVEASIMTAADYQAQSDMLQAECAGLLEHYKALAGAPDLGIGSPLYGGASGSRGSDNAGRASAWLQGAGGLGLPPGLADPSLLWQSGRCGDGGGGACLAPAQAAGTAPPGAPVVEEFAQVAKLIQGNLGRQLMALKRYLCAMQRMRSVNSNVHAALVMYPLSLNALDFGRGLTSFKKAT